MAELTLDVARKILDAALAKAVEKKLKPLVITVLDVRGCVKATAAQDGTSLLRSEIAHGKAYGALAMGMGSRALFQRAQEQAYFIGAANTLAQGRLVPVPGGVLIDLPYRAYEERLAATRRAIEQGAAVRVAGNDVIYPRQQTAVMFFSDHFITNKRALAEGFMRAYIRGVRIYNDALKDGRLAGPRANDVIPILTRYTAIKDESLFRRIVPSWVDPNGEVDATSLKKDLDFFRELGLIEKKDISVDAVVDSSFAKAAVAKLGPYQPSAN